MYIVAFKDDFQNLVVQILQRKAYIMNEEMTKQSMIMPFVKTLGYDVYDPLEVRPEYSAGFAKNKEKVDYAVFKDGKVVMFIEAKPTFDTLTNHDPQLSKYFNSTPEAKVAVITNGIRYKFFTDLAQPNIMDSSPFFEIDCENFVESDIDTVQRFRKGAFDVDNVVMFAEDLIYLSNLKKLLKELLRNPSDDFIRFLIKDISDARLTASVVDRYRPVVKKAITASLLEIVSQGIMRNDDISDEQAELIVSVPLVTTSEQTTSPESKVNIKIITTEEELAAFETIKNILLSAGKDVSDLGYKDTSNYFAVYVHNTSHWILRLNLDASKMNITIPLELEQVKDFILDFKVDVGPKTLGPSRIFIESIDDIKKLSDIVVACYEYAK